MGLIFKILGGLIGFVLLLAIVLGGMYAADTAVEANVIEKQNRGTNCDVTIETQFPIPGIEHTLLVEGVAQCNLVMEGNYVQYFVKSERTVLYQSEGGDCIYDSENGFGNNCGKDA